MLFLPRLLVAAFLAIATLSAPAIAGPDMAPRPGWAVHPTGKSYDVLIGDLRAAVKAAGFAVVTQAGPTDAAKRRGIDIPGNRVLGVFNNVYAVRTLEVSTAAMIEAPIRFYVTENSDGTATLSYKLPTTVFAPYAEDGGATLTDIATELDAAFAAMAEAAVK